MAKPSVDTHDLIALQLQEACNDTLKRLFKTLGNVQKPRLAVALSGGADSMALLHLARVYVDTYGGYIEALTVDHGLRTESVDEAKQVSKWVGGWGIQHHMLKVNWQGDAPPKTDVQARARAERYQLLEAWCSQNHTDFLLTAHHLDDVEETLMMRLWRGAGVEGLSGIPEIRKTDHVTILRPLLAHRKSALLTYLQARQLPWVEDVSNASDDYERNRVRKLLAEFPLPDGQAERFTFMMSRTREYLEQQGADWLIESLHIFADGSATLDASTLPEKQVMFYLLPKLVAQLSGDEKSLRGYESANLLSFISSGLQKSCTLRGLVFKRMEAVHFYIHREPSRIPSALLEHDSVWDKRFRIDLKNATDKASASQALELLIKPLGKPGVATLKAERVRFPTHLNYAAKLGLLSIWHLDHLLAVPHIDYWNQELPEAVQHLQTMDIVPLHNFRQQTVSYPPFSPVEK